MYILSHFGSILLRNSNPDADGLDLVLFYGLYNLSRSDMYVAVILSRIINAVVRDLQHMTDCQTTILELIYEKKTRILLLKIVHGEHQQNN